MSVVALKNAVVQLVSNKKNDNNNASITSTSNSYGAIPTDLERGTHVNLRHDTSDMSGQTENTYTEEQDEEEQHEHTKLFGSLDPRIISDLIIGLSDGLTVPFALTAGLSSLGDSKLVITGGFAELISGAISMGLGGYLGAKSESDYYHAEVKQERKKFFENQTLINHEFEDILVQINPNFSDETIISFIKDFQSTPEMMLDFIIRYGRGLDEPAENRQFISAVTIGGGYLLGGFVPLLPYFFVEHVQTGLLYSIFLMAITLFIFGYFKAEISMGDVCSTPKKVVEGCEMMAVGGIAAASAWYFVKLLG